MAARRRSMLLPAKKRIQTSREYKCLLQFAVIYDFHITMGLLTFCLLINSILSDIPAHMELG